MSNVIVIVLMFVVFALAILAAVPRHSGDGRVSAVMSASAGAILDARLRERAVGALPPEKLLPDKQPSYVSSWIYVFGVLSLSALAVIIGSGTILALKGPGLVALHQRSVTSSTASTCGRSSCSSSSWSSTCGASTGWRHGAAARARVWITGAVTFLVAIPCALTGYVSQQNFDAQWISTQAKDAMNAVGIGSFFNLLNFGQMYTYHVLLLPAAVVALVVAHVLLVRKHGVVPPFELMTPRPPPRKPVRADRRARRAAASREPAEPRHEPRASDAGRGRAASASGRAATAPTTSSRRRRSRSASCSRSRSC